MLAAFVLPAMAAGTPSHFNFVGVGGIVIGAAPEDCNADAAAVVFMIAGGAPNSSDLTCRGARGNFVRLFISPSGEPAAVYEIDIYDPPDQNAALAWSMDNTVFVDVVTNVGDVCPGSKYAVAGGPAPLAGSGDIFLCVAQFEKVMGPDKDAADQTGGAVGIFVYDASNLSRYSNRISSVIFPMSAFRGDDLESDDPAVWDRVNAQWKTGNLIEIYRGGGSCSDPTPYELVNLSSRNDDSVCARRGNQLDEMRRRLGGH
ncbi:MAG TPA: hypothetical protein VMD53_07575 [Rhizomicrobium sp.]|nr:hypothetical protein [Rhizomicrobium sp.]